MAKNDSGASSTQTAKSDSGASSTPTTKPDSGAGSTQTSEPVVVSTAGGAPKAKGPKRYFVARGRALTCARGVISGDDLDPEIKAADLIDGQAGTDDEKLKSAQDQLEELAAKGYLRTE